jgi:hypothetical protein
MPHIVTMNSVRQSIPRMWFPEAITQGKASGYITDVASVQGQFFPFFYPSPGHVPVRMLYKYGSQLLGAMVNGNRWIKAYQHPSLEFIVNQSVWHEGETPYCDVILDGMQTVSGKYELIAQTLKKIEREAWPVQCSKVVFGCERQSLAKRRIAPPEDLRRIRMSIGNHVQQEVRAANHERQYRLRQGSPSNDLNRKRRMK